jgi:ferredoxin
MKHDDSEPARGGDGRERTADDGRVLSRRSALAAAVVVGGGWIALRGRSTPPRLRPPGAAPGDEFLRRCIRCLRCAEVCPPKAILFDTGFDLDDSETPYIEAASRACTLCMNCTQACPSGALTPLAADPEEVFAAVKMGRPVLDEQKCIALTGTGECRACYYVCPYPDRAVRLEGPAYGPAFDAEACVGCGLCEEACPERARAIRIVPRDEVSA